MEGFFNFIGGVQRVQWTRLTIAICLLPALILMGLVFCMTLFVTDDVAAVVATTRECATIGYDAMKDGGSSVDAAIATLLCQGIVLPSNSGIGGGFSAITYMGGTLKSIVATPKVPNGDNAFRKMLFGMMHKKKEAVKAILTVGVPGEILGFWELHQKYGLLPWSRLFEPAIKMCEEGIAMSQFFATILRSMRSDLETETDLRDRFSTDNDVSEGIIEGQRAKLKFPVLAKTLRKIAQHGPDIFYKGELGEAFVADIKKQGGILSMQDLREYNVSWRDDVIRVRLTKHSNLYTTPLPTSGGLIALMLNVLKTFASAKPEVFWHVAVETMKYAHAQRVNLGDAEHDPKYGKLIRKTFKRLISADFADSVRQRILLDRTQNRTAYYFNGYNPFFEGGSSSVCVISKRGNAIAMTSSLSKHFGSRRLSAETGIIMNDVLSSFIKAKSQNVRISPPNQMWPGKRALSPSCPVIVLSAQKATVDMAFAAIGGPRIPTLTVNALAKYFLLRMDAEKAVNTVNLHHQLDPNVLQYDMEDIDVNLLNYLKKCGHEMLLKEVDYIDDPGMAFIAFDHLKPHPVYSLRRDGSAKIFVPTDDKNLFFIVIILFLIFIVLSLIIREILREDDFTHVARSILQSVQRTMTSAQRSMVET